jgi:hypothetical protein
MVLTVQAPSGYARTDSAAHVPDGGELVDQCVDPAALPVGRSPRDLRTGMDVQRATIWPL